MRRHHQRARGMALVQALVIVAAMAAVAAALLLRAEGARERLAIRFEADQLALYLDSGQGLIISLLGALVRDAPVHRGQDWANPRAGVMIDRGTLAWQVDDLHARLNVNDLAEGEALQPLARTAFEHLATTAGISRAATRRLVDALGAGAGGQSLPLPLADARQLWALVPDEGAAMTRLLGLLAARPAGSPVNINTVHAPVLAALFPDLPESVRAAIQRRLRREPARSIEDFIGWATEALGPEIAERLAAVPLSTASDLFTVTLEARLDTLRLRRSVVLNRNGAQGRVAVILSMPEPEPEPE